MTVKRHSKLWLLLLAGATIIIFIFVLILPGINCEPVSAKKVLCMSNLKNLHLACLMYQEDTHQWPTKTNWCDALKPYYKDDEIVRCPADKTGPCSYAMNENIPADANELPPDLVVLFESAPGWNSIGSADDVVTDRHNRPGANIVFADGHVEFVDPEDIPNLQWTIKDKKSQP